MGGSEKSGEAGQSSLSFFLSTELTAEPSSLSPDSSLPYAAVEKDTFIGLSNL